MEIVELTQVNSKYEITITYNSLYYRTPLCSRPAPAPIISTQSKTYPIAINPNNFNVKVVLPFLIKVIESETSAEVNFIEATCNETITYTSNTGKIYYSKSLYFKFDSVALEELLKSSHKTKK
jgi:hypothetical protein